MSPSRNMTKTVRIDPRNKHKLCPHELAHQIYSYRRCASLIRSSLPYSLADPGGTNSFNFVQFLPPANEVWGKVIFSVACVKNSVHGGGVCFSACWDITPRTRHHPPGPGTPGTRHPMEQTPPPHSPGTRYPPGQGTPWGKHPHPYPREQTPPLHSACWDIQSTSGRYASYWNAFLLRKFGKIVCWRPWIRHCYLTRLVLLLFRNYFC